MVVVVVVVLDTTLRGGDGKNGWCWRGKGVDRNGESIGYVRTGMVEVVLLVMVVSMVTGVRGL